MSRSRHVSMPPRLHAGLKVPGHGIGPHTSFREVTEDGRRELGKLSAVAAEGGHVERCNNALDALKLCQSREGAQDEFVRSHGSPAHAWFSLGGFRGLRAAPIQFLLIRRSMMDGEGRRVW